MEAFVQRMIDEHAELLIRIDKLEEYIYNPKNNDDKIEYANKCLQLRGMKIYAEALGVRLANQGIQFDGENYAEIVAQIREENVEVPPTEAGSDYDVDKENIENNK